MTEASGATENTMRATLYCGDALEVLGTLPDGAARCCVTSPPYWGLRNYGISGQLGLERTPEEYVAKLVVVLREVRRVLTDDGTLWLNLGDSYSAGAMTGAVGPNSTTGHHRAQHEQRGMVRVAADIGLAPKQLVGIPWRVAFALQADGWVLRQEVIWSKGNPMPESVRDRCTRAHEQVFMFSKARWIGEGRGNFGHLSDEDARWLALLLDTEGNIVVKRAVLASGKTTFGVQIAVANTSRLLVERTAALVGVGSIHERPGRNAPVFYWQTGNVQARHLLHRLLPHFIVKGQQARLAIHLQDLIAASVVERRAKDGRTPRGRTRSDSYTRELERCWATMKALNHFQSPDLSWVPDVKFGHWDSAAYYYDADAIAEPASCETTKMPDGWDTGAGAHGTIHRQGREKGRRTDKQRGHSRRHVGFNDRWDAMERSEQCSGTRNARSVWTIATQPYREAHFATFPEEMARRCILAGSAPGDTVLDPFGGSGTTAAVAVGHGRNAIYIDLNPDYLHLAEQRIGPLLCHREARRG